MISGIRRWMGGMARPRMGRRIAALCLSVTAMGLCVAVFDRIGLGTDPCSTMNLGLSRKIGLPFGTTQLLVNLLMLIAVLRFDIGRIGMGTIANMVFVGYIAEFGMAVLDRMPDLGALPLGARLAIFLPSGRRAVRRRAPEHRPARRQVLPPGAHGLGYRHDDRRLPARLHGRPGDDGDRLLPGADGHLGGGARGAAV